MTATFDAPHPTTVPLRTAHDVLAAVPYRLGFRPAESIVLACTSPADELALVARVDITDAAGPDAESGLEPLARAVVSSGATSCLLALYTAHDPAAAATAVNLVEQLVDPAVALDRWVVTPDGYRGMDCQDPTCCPEPGHPLASLDSGPVGAAHVLAGHVVAESAEAAYRVQRAPEDVRNLVGRAARRSELAREGADDGGTPAAWRDGALATWQEALRRAATVSGEVLAIERLRPALLGRVAAALADRTVRDAVMLSLVPDASAAVRAIVTGAEPEEVEAATARALDRVIDPQDAVPPDAEVAARARAVLEQVDAAAPRRLRAPGLTLLTFLAWWSGDGPRASYRIRQALEIDGDYRLARLLECVVVAGLPPGWVRVANGSV